MATQNTMGRILTTLTITNRLDQGVAQRGLISEEQVRSITLDNVLVDTGATTLCLTSDAIEELGLELLREVDVGTANGVSKARIFQNANINLMGRIGTFECLELPGDRDPFIRGASLGNVRT